jgi:hypothetical protein
MRKVLHEHELKCGAFAIVSTMSITYIQCIVCRGVILGPEKKPGKVNNNSGKRPSMQGTAGSASGGGWNLMGMKQRYGQPLFCSHPWPF